MVNLKRMFPQKLINCIKRVEDVPFCEELLKNKCLGSKGSIKRTSLCKHVVDDYSTGPRHDNDRMISGNIVPAWEYEEFLEEVAENNYDVDIPFWLYTDDEYEDADFAYG